MRTETPSTFERISIDRFSQSHLSKLLYSVAVVSTFSLLVALSKEYLRVPLHIPGHSAVYVIPLMLSGKILSRNRLGGTGIGGLSGITMAFLGLGGGYLLGIPRYLFMGAVIDVLLWNRAAHNDAIYLVAAGLFANFAKFFVGLIVATLVGIPVFFIHLGLTYSVATHLMFGAIGGLIAYSLLRISKRIRHHSLRG